MLVVISNMLKRYSFQIPVLYVQQLYSCCYLERLLIIGLILSCRCYCFYYRSNWFNRLLLLYERFVSGSSASVRWRYRQYVPVPNPLFCTVVSDLSCYSHVVRVRLSDFRFQFLWLVSYDRFRYFRFRWAKS